MSVEEMTKFFKERPKYREVLERAIEVEEKHQKDPNWLGWEWHEVRAYPAQLVKMVIEGVIKVNFKSNSSTTYLIVDKKLTTEALAKLSESR